MSAWWGGGERAVLLKATYPTLPCLALPCCLQWSRLHAVPPQRSPSLMLGASTRSTQIHTSTPRTRIPSNVCLLPSGMRMVTRATFLPTALSPSPLRMFCPILHVQMCAGDGVLGERCGIWNVGLCVGHDS
eukprot:357074-Chlamydomonas_euryale.AAC.7